MVSPDAAGFQNRKGGFKSHNLIVPLTMTLIVKVSKFVVGAMKAFQLAGFETSFIIADGVQTNLSFNPHCTQPSGRRERRSARMPRSNTVMNKLIPDDTKHACVLGSHARPTAEVLDVAIKLTRTWWRAWVDLDRHSTSLQLSQPHSIAENGPSGETPHVEAKTQQEPLNPPSVDQHPSEQREDCKQSHSRFLDQAISSSLEFNRLQADEHNQSCLVQTISPRPLPVRRQFKVKSFRALMRPSGDTIIIHRRPAPRSGHHTWLMRLLNVGSNVDVHN